MKRFSIVLIALTLLVCMLASCAGDTATGTATSAQAETDVSTTSVASQTVTPTETPVTPTPTETPVTPTPTKTPATPTPTETPVTPTPTETPVTPTPTETPVTPTPTETPVTPTPTETPVTPTPTETPVTPTPTETPVTPTPTETPVTPTPTETPQPQNVTVTITQDELYDKIAGGWIGQMVGVAWGAPTEFCWAAELIPEDRVPKWSASMVNNAFDQDDLYVEIPFMDVMKKNGYDCSMSALAKAFKNSTFALWHANGMGRENLRKGIDYPDTGSYLYNYHCDDIDWQIECDFLGMMYPGLVSEAAEHAFRIGHIMNYGDGVYGGVFVTAMHAAAFTAQSVEEICLAGMSVIPDGTEFKTLITEVYDSWKAGDTFEQNWRKLQDKWGDVDICPELQGVSNIDAKLNSGYILLGMLYGEGDIAKTIVLSMRCGQDSDCNPSSAASILGNFYGASALPEEYTSALKHDTQRFATTTYTFDGAVELNMSLAEQVLAGIGAAKSEDGNFTFETAAQPAPVPFEQVPDGVYIYTYVKAANNTLRFYEVTPFSKNEKVTGYEIDVGDGTVYYSVTPFAHPYESAGEYTVKYTVYGDKGTVFTKEETVKIKKDPTEPVSGPIIICSVTNPTGGGSKQINVINDGYIPKTGDGDGKQYDTYILGDPHGNPDRTIYIGYIFKSPVDVDGIVFTEGNHFGNGGWFKDGNIGVEVLVDGKWIKVETTLYDPYPVGDSRNIFGNPYETYTFTFNDSIYCDGVRLIGLGGGSATFISVGELTVISPVP